MFKKSLLMLSLALSLSSMTAFAGTWSSPVLFTSGFQPAPAIPAFVGPLNATSTTPLSGYCSDIGATYRYHERATGGWRGPVYYFTVNVYQQNCLN